MPKTTTKRSTQRTELRYGELDRDRVVSAVLELAERQQSLENVTMRALATHLGISPAAMYYHVRDRGELLDVTTESVLARVKVPSAELSWDAQLRALFVDARRVMLPVKGIAGTLQSRPVSPSGQRLNQAATNILKVAGFSSAASRTANMALSTFVLGAIALEQATEPTGRAAPKPRSTTALRFRSRDFAAGLDLIIAGLKYQKESA